MPRGRRRYPPRSRRARRTAGRFSFSYPRRAAPAPRTNPTPPTIKPLWAFRALVAAAVAANSCSVMGTTTTYQNTVAGLDLFSMSDGTHPTTNTTFPIMIAATQYAQVVNAFDGGVESVAPFNQRLGLGLGIGIGRS